MISLFDRAVVGLLPVVPKFVVSRVAQRYVAGATRDDAIAVIRQLNRQGAMVTVDVLGEEIDDRAHAEAAVLEYEALIDRLAQEQLEVNVSVKLTMFGLSINTSFCQDNLAKVAARAARCNGFVRIDMEDHTCTDVTLGIYNDLRETHGNLGVVLQAMLRRTQQDIAILGPRQTKVRLCKGIYREPENVAFLDFEEVRKNYVACLDLLFKHGCYVGIATHDSYLIDEALKLIERYRLSPEQYEFQMLHGVTPEQRQRLISHGHRLRVYVPYGQDWYAYSLRRLRENPTVARHVMKAFFVNS